MSVFAVVLLNFITSWTLYTSHRRVVMIAWLMSPHLSVVWLTTWSLQAYVSLHLLSSPGYRRHSLSSFLLLNGPMNSTDLCSNSCVSPKKTCMCNTSTPWSVPCSQRATRPPPNHKPPNCLGWKRLSPTVTPALPYSPPSHVHSFRTLPGMEIPPLPWAACSTVPSHSKPQFCEAVSKARKSTSSRPMVRKLSHAFLQSS